MKHFGKMAPAALVLWLFACSDGTHSGSSLPSLAEEREAALRRLDAADAAFEQEPRSAEWADEMERTLSKTFAQEQHVGIKISSVLCKATACRVEAMRNLVQSDAGLYLDTGAQIFHALREVPSGSFQSYLVQAADRGFWVAFMFRPVRRQSPVEAAYYESISRRE